MSSPVVDIGRLRDALSSLDAESRRTISFLYDSLAELREERSRLHNELELERGKAVAIETAVVAELGICTRLDYLERIRSLRRIESAEIRRIEELDRNQNR